MTEPTPAPAPAPEPTPAPTPAPAPAPAPAAGFDWKGALGDKAPAYEPMLTAKGWKSPAEALEGYANLEKLVGTDKIALPGKDAKPEEWEAVFNKLGRPEKPDGYQFQKPEGFEGYDDAFAGTFRGAAHAAGLSAKQAAALHDWWVGAAKGGATQQAEAEAARVAEVAKTMDTEWGAAKAEKRELAKRAAKALGATDDGLEAIEKGLGNFAAMKLLAAYGETLKEAPLDGKGSGVGTPAEAQAEMARLRGDPEFNKAWTDRSHAGHAEAVRRMTALGAQANPTATTAAPQ